MREFGYGQEEMKTLLDCIAATMLEHFRATKTSSTYKIYFHSFLQFI